MVIPSAFHGLLVLNPALSTAKPENDSFLKFINEKFKLEVKSLNDLSYVQKQDLFIQGLDQLATLIKNANLENSDIRIGYTANIKNIISGVTAAKYHGDYTDALESFLNLLYHCDNPQLFGQDQEWLSILQDAWSNTAN